CGAGDHVRLLPAQGFEKGAVVRPAKARPRELVALGVLPSRADEPAAFESRQRLRYPLQRPDRRLDEKLEADERRNRIAGQPEHERPLADSERERLAGLDGTAPEDLPVSRRRPEPRAARA